MAPKGRPNARVAWHVAPKHSLEKKESYLDSDWLNNAFSKLAMVSSLVIPYRALATSFTAIGSYESNALQMKRPAKLLFANKPSFVGIH